MTTGNRSEAITAYLDAAGNKVALSRGHLADLDVLRAGEEHERRQIQAAFEGVIANGNSAGDQVTAALAAAIGLDLGRRNTPRELLRTLGDDLLTAGDLAVCVDGLRTWADDPIVRDARERRNLAVHAHYEKRPYKLHRTWLLEEVTPHRGFSPYQGVLEIHDYCETYVATLTHVERVVDCVLARR